MSRHHLFLAFVLAGLSGTAWVAGSCGSAQDEPPGGAGSPGSGDASTDRAGLDSRADGTARRDAGADGTQTPDEAGASCADDSGPPWVWDQAYWKSIPELSFTDPPCVVTEAKTSMVPPMPLQWQSCGSGCEWADLVQGLGDLAGFPVTFVAGDSQHQETYLTLRHHMPCTEPVVVVFRVIRLSDGVTIAALKLKTDLPPGAPAGSGLCIFWGSGMVTGVGIDRDITSPYTLGRAPRDGGAWTWASPPTRIADEPAANTGFEFDYHGGTRVGIGLGLVWAMDDPTTNRWKVLEQPSGAQTGAGSSDLGIWTDNGEPGFPRVRGWAPDGKGVRDIAVGLTDYTTKLALSWDHMVGIAGDGTGGIYTRARFWVSPRAYDVTQAKVVYGPDLITHRVGLGDWSFVTSADFAVVGSSDVLEGGRLSDQYYVIVDLNGFRGYRVDALAGRWWVPDVAGMTHSYLYLFDSLPSDGYNHRARRIYRLELSKIDQWAKAL